MLVRQDPKCTRGPAAKDVTGTVLENGHILQYIPRLILYFATDIKLLAGSGQTRHDDQYGNAAKPHSLSFMG